MDPSKPGRQAMLPNVQAVSQCLMVLIKSVHLYKLATGVPLCCSWAKQVGEACTDPEELGCIYHVYSDPDAFTVQVIRSIDGRSCVFEDARSSCLFLKKGRDVDQSIYKVKSLFGAVCIGV